MKIVSYYNELIEWRKREFQNIRKYLRVKQHIKEIYQKEHPNELIQEWFFPLMSEMMLGGQIVKVDVIKKILSIELQRGGSATKEEMGWKQNSCYVALNIEILNCAMFYDLIIEAKTPQGIFYVTPEKMRMAIENDWFKVKKGGFLKIFVIPIYLTPRLLESVKMKPLTDFFLNIS